MGKAKTIAEEAAEQAAEKVFARHTELFGGPPSPDTQKKLEEDEQEAPFEDTDIFSYCENAFIKKGEGIRYYIDKDYAQLTTEAHPCSWEKIQEKFGGGHYTVKAKHIKKGTFIKQETRDLMDPPEVDEEETSDFKPEASPRQPGMTEFLAFMQHMNAQQEASRRADRERMTTLLSTLVPVLAPVLQGLLSKPKEGVDPSTQMLIEFLKESNRNQQAQMQAILDRMERLKESAEPKADPMALMRQLQEAEDRGWNRRKEITEEIDEKAEARAAELAAQSGDKEESLTSTLIKSMVPVLGQLATQRAVLPEHEAPLALTQASEPRSLPPVTQAQSTAPLRPVQVAPVTPLKPASSSQPKTAQVLPKETSKTAPSAKTSKEKVVETLVPYFAKTLTELASGKNVQPQEAVEGSLKELAKQGFTREEVVKLFTHQDLMTIVKGYQLPEQVHPWFNQYYAYLVNPTGVDDRGTTEKRNEPAQGRETR